MDDSSHLGYRSPMKRAPLRLAVVTDRPVQPWQAQCVDALASVPNVAVERWLQIGAPEASDSVPTSRATTAVAMPVALLDLQPENAESTPAGAGSAEHVDLLVDLTAGGLDAPVGWASESWRFGYGISLSRDPARASLANYVRGSGAIRVAVVREPSGGVVAEGWLQAVSWWTGQPIDELRLQAVALAEDATRRHAGAGVRPPAGSERRDDDRSGLLRSPGEDRLATVPMPLLKVAAAGRRVRGWGAVLTRHHDWNVGIVDVPIDRWLDGAVTEPITWLPARPGRFAADPFGVERDGVLHVFFEDFDRRLNRGTIAHLAVQPDGSMTEPVCVLDTGSHLSYPYLVEHDGGVFMLPESSAAGELVLYEAVDFPLRWRPIATLMTGIPAVDASVIEHEGRWWMLATRYDHGANHSLFAWHAPRLNGPWVPHERNPVKTDVRSGRPGGTPFVSAGRLYRPSQDSSRIYGGRVIVNLVDELSPTAFLEHPVIAVEPPPGSRYPAGLHTISAAGSRTLIDGNRLRFVRESLVTNVASKLPGRQSP